MGRRTEVAGIIRVDRNQTSGGGRGLSVKCGRGRRCFDRAATLLRCCPQAELQGADEATACGADFVGLCSTRTVHGHEPAQEERCTLRTRVLADPGSTGFDRARRDDVLLASGWLGTWTAMVSDPQSFHRLIHHRSIACVVLGPSVAAARACEPSSSVGYQGM